MSVHQLRRSTVPLTDDETSVLLRYFDAGKTVKHLARMYWRTESYVREVLVEQGREPPPPHRAPRRRM